MRVCLLPTRVLPRWGQFVQVLLLTVNEHSAPEGLSICRLEYNLAINAPSGLSVKLYDVFASNFLKSSEPTINFSLLGIFSGQQNGLSVSWESTRKKSLLQASLSDHLWTIVHRLSSIVHRPPIILPNFQGSNIRRRACAGICGHRGGSSSPASDSEAPPFSAPLLFCSDSSTASCSRTDWQNSPCRA